MDSHENEETFPTDSTTSSLCRKKTIRMFIIIAILIGLHIFVVVMWFSVHKKSAAGPSPPSQCFLYIISCPKSWVGYEGRCYYFSDVEGTWDFAQRQCSSYNASLSSIDTPEEMDFLMRYKISADHWFGLRRQTVGESWKWTNDSIFNNWFTIRAKGFCAYLDDEGASSTRCDTERNWICTKPLHSVGMEKPPGPPTDISSFENCTVFTNL
ncbi:C-type lectin domain family 2 member B-like isoform X2 [Eublepharis macularius]|uniref:C-type lectin domain family 2 member B-like isoform X2 n=1 Tax=Eublepharis macularius TaxID=481883 RepID=A0AA97J4U4_EUBMA|nr:C-type lectin domain family 2 member B-like isoform X2 [Eublepharis macularius]